MHGTVLRYRIMIIRTSVYKIATHIFYNECFKMLLEVLNVILHCSIYAGQSMHCLKAHFITLISSQETGFMDLAIYCNFIANEIGMSQTDFSSHFTLMPFEFLKRMDLNCTYVVRCLWYQWL